MPYKIAADLVLLLHLAFILFVVVGGIAALRRRWIVWPHLPAVLWGGYIELSGGICPLTPLENRLRVAAGEAGYPGGFIAHYLLPLIYPAGLTRWDQILLGGVVIGVNLAVYAVLVTRWRRRGV